MKFCFSFLSLACAICFSIDVAKAQSSVNRVPQPVAVVPTSVKELVQYGWNPPDTAFIRQNIRQMEKLPFEGVVLKANFTDENGTRRKFEEYIWSNYRIPPEGIRQAILDLRATPFTTFKSNFTRLNVIPGDVDWFDDFSNLLSNVRLLGRFVQKSGLKGIYVDLEAYDKELFQYRSQKYARSVTFEQYARQAERRGAEVMQALLNECPECVFVYSFMHEQAGPDASRWAVARYGLLPSFIDGMLREATDTTKIVNSYQDAYNYEYATEFERAVRIMTERNRQVSRYPAKMALITDWSFSIWMDLFSKSVGWFPADVRQNPRTPEQFEESLYRAFARTKQYVWLYTQVPNWWTLENIPKSYIDAIRRARRLAELPEL
jgi:hypothetical protein